MPTDEPLEPWNGDARATAVFRVLPWLMMAFGPGCVTGALLVGAYTVFGASRPDIGVDNAYSSTVHRATELGWAVAGLAALLLIVLALCARHLESLRVRRVVRLSAATAGIGVVVAYQRSHFTHARHEVEYPYPTFEQMWTVSAAVLLLAVGAAVTAAFVATGSRRPGRSGVVGLALGIVAACVLTASLGVHALHKGDDSRYIDATTAPGRPIPALPAALGQQRFQLSLPYLVRDQILPAGAGFIVIKHDGPDTADVVAYGSAGDERWHYRRTGPVSRPGRYGPYVASVRDVDVFDGLSVAVLSLDSGVHVGLDAVTGRQLWTSADPAMSVALAHSSTAFNSPHFVAHDDQHWTAFDPRTGKRLWRIDNPAHCPSATEEPDPLPNFHDTHGYPIDTASQVGAVIDCSTRERVDLRVVVVDPATGAVTADKALTSLDCEKRADIESWSAAGVPGGDAVQLNLYAKSGSPNVYVDLKTGHQLEFPGASPVRTVGDGTFTVREPAALRLYSRDAVAGCAIPLGTPYYSVYAFLADQVVVRDPNRPVLHIFDRASCRELSTVAVPPQSDVSFMLVAPGLTLLINASDEKKTALVTGFGPADPAGH